ncbi:MAG TPA: alpha/beta hydrolase [Hyphomicrobiaceae bacterium]|nr:alpha/beta hydrolase [Hyphomicrobiaceae bacterium]
MDELYALMMWSVLVAAGLALLVYATAKVVEYRNPPVGKFLDIDGTRLHYYERGSGLPVVFLHGNATMLQDFSLSEAFDSASKQNRAIAFDRPGFGYSTRPATRAWTPSEQAELIAEALRRLHCVPAEIVGHSWGTLVALALAERHPAMVRSLVLLSGFFYPAPRVDAGMAVIGATPVVGDILRYTLSPLIGLIMLHATLRAMFAPSPVPDRFRREFPRLMMLRPWQLRASFGDGAMMLQAAAALQRIYPALRVPTFIAAGSDDRIVAPWHSERLHQEVPDSDLDVIAGIGHMVQHSAPDRVAATVERAARTIKAPLQ